MYIYFYASKILFFSYFFCIYMRPGNTKAIEEMFNSISSKYDFLNDIFSFGLHRLWKKKIVGYS